MIDPHPSHGDGDDDECQCNCTRCFRGEHCGRGGLPQVKPYGGGVVIDPANDWCQRWQAGRQQWRHVSDGGFNWRDGYEVAPLGRDRDAREFLSSNHYLTGYPAALVRLGLHHGPFLVGVAVFSAPMSNHVLTGAFPDLVPNQESMELGRFALLEPEPGNAESWFLGQCFRYLAERGVRGIVSFSDPTPRLDRTGQPVFGGHIGTIYQATNFQPAGRTRTTAVTLLPDGSVLGRREEQKVVAQERGHAYVERRLYALGAPQRQAGEEPADWLRRVYAALGVRRQRELGKHRYVQAIGPRRRLVRIGLDTSGPYPKRVDPVELLAVAI